jgi:hypothetical protein
MLQDESDYAQRVAAFMTIDPASKKPVSGTSLIETLFATLLTTLAFTTLATVAISSNKTSQKEITRLLLYSSGSQSLRFIREELQRAYFVSIEGDAGDEVHYSFQDQQNYIHATIKADLSQSKLKYCSESRVDLLHTHSCSRFYSVFDSSQVRLDRLLVRQINQAGRLKSPLIQLTLTVSWVVEHELNQSNATLTLTTVVALRNWDEE